MQFKSEEEESKFEEDIESNDQANEAEVSLDQDDIKIKQDQ